MPFKKGNQLARTHGASSELAIREIKDKVYGEILAVIKENLPHLAAGDQLMVEAVAAVGTQLRLVDNYMNSQGGALVNRQGKPRPYAELWLGLYRLYSQGLGRLGADPMSRSKILANAVESEGIDAQLARRRLTQETT